MTLTTPAAHDARPGRGSRPARSLASAGIGTAALLLLALLALATPAQADVNVYSARKEELIKPLLDRFTAGSGIPVKLVTANAGELMKRLELEGANSPADVFITVDAGNLHAAQEAGLLQPVDSAALESAIPAAYRHPQGYWFGLSLRARPIMVAKGRVDTSHLTTYADLADARWKGRICIRSSSNIYNQSLVASLIESLGENETLIWLKAFVSNFARDPKGGDTDQIKAVAAGECDIAIANTYYLARLVASDDKADRDVASKIQVVWPNQGGRGTHVNVSGAGVTAASKNVADAVRLLEYLVTPEAQQWYAEVNNEYPVREGVKLSDAVASLGSFSADDLNLSILGENNRRAVMLMDEARWK